MTKKPRFYWILRVAVCTTVCLAALKLQAQLPTTPYRVHVVGEDAVIHSGPSSNFYGTDRLPPGATVDVYRNDPGGWMAIRPPEGSFSLVQLDELELLENGLARITVDKAVAWVGTRLTAVKKPMWQVRMRKGEVVDVLGIVDRQIYELGQEEPDWVQIKPPAGEFRWIAATNLDLRNTEPIKTSDDQQNGRSIANENQPLNSIVNDQWSTEPEGANIPRDLNLAPPPREITQRMAPIGALDAGTGSSFGSNDDWSMDIEPAPISSDWSEQPGLDMDSSRAAAPENPNNGWRPAQQPITNFVAERSEFNADGSRVQQDLQVWNHSTELTGNSSSHARSDVFDSTDSYTSAGNFSTPANSTTAIPNGIPSDGSLTSLEWRLSQEMLKQSPQQWELQGIARDVQYLNDSTPDSQIRAATGRMLEKIRKCREIQAGYEATDGPAPGDLITRQNFNGPINNLQAAGISLAANNELLNEYDAYGWLCELIVDGGLGQSRFAIKDDAGRITHEITALPGLNLRRYLNQRVGIVGNRGFDQKLNLNHVTAERVIPVDTLRR